MAKTCREIEYRVKGTPDELGVWHTESAADVTVAVIEYPDVPEYRKGIPIVLTPEQQAAVDDFFRTVVLPQAQAAL